MLVIRNSLIIGITFVGIILIIINVYEVKQYGTRYQWFMAVCFLILIEYTLKLFQKVIKS